MEPFERDRIPDACDHHVALFRLAFKVECARVCGLYEHELDAWLAGRMAGRAGGLPPLGCGPPLPRWQFRLDDVPVVCGICLLRLRDVESVVGIRRTQIYRFVGERRYPAPVSLGERTARWVAHEVQVWLRERCPWPGRAPGSGVSMPVAFVSALAHPGCPSARESSHAGRLPRVWIVHRCEAVVMGNHDRSRASRRRLALLQINDRLMRLWTFDVVDRCLTWRAAIWLVPGNGQDDATQPFRVFRAN